MNNIIATHLQQNTLESFKSSPYFGQCYPPLLHSLRKMALETGHRYSEEDFRYIFAESQESIISLIKCNSLEIEICNEISILQSDSMHRRICKNIHIFSYEQAGQILFFIQCMCLIVLWDILENKSDEVIEAFKQCRNYLEKELSELDNDNELWTLVVKRIPLANIISFADLQVEVSKLNNKLTEKETEITKLKDEMAKIESGYIRTEEGMKPSKTAEKIMILRHLLNVGTNLEGEPRAEFKKLCKYFTNAEDTTLERLLSQNELTKMEKTKEDIMKSFPILTSYFE